MKLSYEFKIALFSIFFMLVGASLGFWAAADIADEERGETMTLVQVQAWCTYANAVDYHNSGATEQQVMEALPKMQEFCGQSINHFLRMLEGQEEPIQ